MSARSAAYLRRYAARRTLETLFARPPDEIDIQALHGELAAVVRRTLKPSQVWLWLRGQGVER